MKPRYLVSACLIGENCKYNGGNNFSEDIAELYKIGALAPICPEVLGGLSTPRTPSEIINDKVINKLGHDVTAEFTKGAESALNLADTLHINKAILKENSPSCGINKVYDGSFSNKLVDGKGVTAQLLFDNGFKLYSENTKPVYDAIILCAGDSKRCEMTYNKVFAYCKDAPMIEKTIEPFLCDLLCKQIIIVCKKEEEQLFKAILPEYKIKYVYGGSSREESTLNGLKEAISDYVLIHDGDRPYVQTELIDYIVDEMIKHNNAVPFITSLDESRDYVTNNKSIQTPQGFKTKDLLDCFNKVKDLSVYRDESSIYELTNNVNYIKGDLTNKKITYIEDIKDFENYEDK